MTSDGQCAPAQMRPMQAKRTTSAATIQMAMRQRGPTCGAIAIASMNASQVKNSAWPLG